MILNGQSSRLLVLALLLSGSIQAASTPALEARQAMVVTAQRLASKVGLDILKIGGNAVDAAVAVGYAQAVVNPRCGNFGGGFMTIHLADGRDSFINFHEKAPVAASEAMCLDGSGQVVKDA